MLYILFELIIMPIRIVYGIRVLTPLQDPYCYKDEISIHQTNSLIKTHQICQNSYESYHVFGITLFEPSFEHGVEAYPKIKVSPKHVKMMQQFINANKDVEGDINQEDKEDNTLLLDGMEGPKLWIISIPI